MQHAKAFRQKIRSAKPPDILEGKGSSFPYLNAGHSLETGVETGPPIIQPPYFTTDGLSCITRNNIKTNIVMNITLLTTLLNKSSSCTGVWDAPLAISATGSILIFVV